MARLRNAIGVAIFVAAFGVGQPFAGLAGIIEIEHRGDGVDAQAVDMIAVDPIERAGVKEIGDLLAAEIVDRGAPVGSKAFARIGVLVERAAVEMRQAVRVGGEMRGHPVEDHAEPRRVRAIDEARESFRLAEAPRRREQPDRLIAPGRVERMLADRQQLEMREAEIDGVGNQLVREFVVAQEAIVVAAPP